MKARLHLKVAHPDWLLQHRMSRLKVVCMCGNLPIAKVRCR